MGRIGPETPLHPFIQKWPTPNLRAETLFLHWDGNHRARPGYHRAPADAETIAHDPHEARQYQVEMENRIE